MFIKSYNLISNFLFVIYNILESPFDHESAFTDPIKALQECSSDSFPLDSIEFARSCDAHEGVYIYI